ncbi:MAG TPA: S8 family serine peptidase [Pyrinomonadaceae bacterium]|nr:S8 family serine peptidase [Pyrinomonadaceae bacterium]
MKSSRSTQEHANAAHRAGELLVRFRPGVSNRDKETIRATYGARMKKDLRGESGIEKLEVSPGGDVRSAATQMLLSGQVEFTEPNFVIAKDDVIANDARFNEQWALRNTGQNDGQFGSDVHTTGAWETTTGSKFTVIAVIDSGIDFTHPDLANNQWLNPAPNVNGDVHGWDYVDDSAQITDEQGHGTAIAGIIAAEGNNSLGTTGVMWRASLMSLRVLDNTGTGDVANAIEAIDYAVAHGAQVINLSWGTNGESLALKEAIERALRRNVIVVCSAGNGSRDLAAGAYYPASFDLKNLISVAGTDNHDRLASWSNWGVKSVTVAAPGTNILTTQRGGGYWNVNGTSAAAPIVAGIAGLVKTFRPGVTAQAVARAVTQGARKTVSLSGKVASGGVVNAEDVLAKAHGAASQSPAFPHLGQGHAGNGPSGSFNGPPPPITTGVPGTNLPNITELRNAKPQEKAKAPIEANLPCADCDPSGGSGGAGNYPAGDPNFSTARSRPANETGEPGVDLGSRNFNWSAPLLYLRGRAGLDLSLTLFYNSLVWTKDGSLIKFNGDLGSPAPGFSLGLPKLQQRFLNSQTGIHAYMLVTPAGSRVELRQVGSSSIYESQDSNYTQLDITDPNAPVVRTTDGTKFKFIPVAINSEYRCERITDRNGNYVSASYNSSNGHLEDLTDTLGRLVDFVYDGSGNLQAIRQTWNGTAHDWATFDYGQVTVFPQFVSTLSVNGPTNNNTTVLTRVNFHDGTYVTFEYNAAFAQVKRINRYATDGHLLSYISYNVSSAAGQDDCPRFTERKDWAENWNNGDEAVTSYSVSGSSWSQQTLPDGTIYKEIFATSGWQSGLTITTEVWSGGVKKKWTSIAWTQDDTGLSYQKNPRVTETNVYDAENNHRRMVFTYYPTSSFSLPMGTYEYAADGVTLLRRTHTNYNLNSVYIDRRIIGLPSGKYVFDGNDNLYKFDVFDYDYGGGCLSDTPQPAIRHDSAYGVSFLSGRGNLSLVRRANVNDPANQWQNTVYCYNTTGSVTTITDPLSRSISFSYIDAFSDAVNRNTFAYPTTVTDADGFQAKTKYNFDFGASTWIQTPSPNAGQTAPTRTMTYDSAARLQQITNGVNGAYVRWVYPSGSTSVQTFSTVVAGAGEAYSVAVLDGAGRVRATAADHLGSTGLYSAQHFVSDKIGRLVQQSNPTEVNASWTPVGDDTAWVYTVQAYDWKSRPTLTTLPDGSTRENIYGGCGCAGGEVTTVRDERGRRRKYTKDVLGRLKQVDELNWNQTVYATTSYTYNPLDQVTQINQAGQLRTFVYDGYGRLATRTTPEQGATIYSYFADNTVQTITDARGATTTFSYNNRRLVTGITYGVPGGVAATSNVTYGYNSAGDRTSMTDGLGSVSYVYDQLSRLTSETRSFTGVGSYALTYSYNLGGELTSITNAWGAQVGYNYDKTGRVSSISGSGYGGVSSYVSSLSYRAFGLKQMSYGNGRTLSLQYDTRLRPTSWSIPGVLRMQYGYAWENSGRVEFARNQDDETLDRYFAYDQVGRLFVSRSGNEARLAVGEQVPLLYNGPYSHNYLYDQWGNLTAREGWGGDNPVFTATYTNNKRDGLTYDAAGNLTNDGGLNYTYDATGQQATASYSGYLLQQYYDGNGLRAKKNENTAITYYLRSTVLGGQIVAEISSSGTLQRGYVYLGGELLAVQQSNAVSWVHQDPIVKSKRVTNGSGVVVSTIELDPWGGNTNRNNNAAFQPQAFTTYTRDSIAADDAMFRRYNRWWSRFDQPDPYDGSYNLANPQSFNRYAYVNNDPVNFVDPKGLDPDEEPPPGPLDRIITNTRDRAYTGVFGGGDTGITIEDPTGGEGGDFDLPGITKSIDARIAEDDCAQFAKTVLDQLSGGKGPTLEETANAFFNQNHDLFTRTRPDGSRGEATALGTLKKSKATMYLRKSEPNEQTSRDAHNVIQELFHFAGKGFGGYSDEQLARAVTKTKYKNTETAAFPDGTANIFDKRYIPGDWGDEDGYSTYFHAISSRYCGILQPNTYRNLR